MKPNEQLFDTLGGIDEELITAAAPGRRRARTTPLRRLLPLAACFALAAIIGVAAWRMQTPTPLGTKDPHRPVTADTNALESFPATEHELAVIPRWEELTTPARFGEFTVGEIRYHTRVTEIDAASVGERLGDSSSRGYDIYTDTEHTATLSYYAIDGIAPECALAARFEGEETYYVYVNSWYRPETLEELLTALNLRENMSFGDFHASFFYEDRCFEQVTFRDPDDSIVWEWLLSDTTLENVYDEVGWYGSALSVSVNIPLLGYENIGLWVTEDGHLVTNILDTGKAFFIGEDKVRDFIAYVVAHCTDRQVTVVNFSHPDDGEGAVTAVEGTVEMTTQGLNPDMPRTSNASPHPAEQPDVTVTSPAYSPNFTTSEE